MLALRLDEYEIPQAKVQHAARHGSNVAVKERVHEHDADAASDVQRREAVEGLLETRVSCMLRTTSASTRVVEVNNLTDLSLFRQPWNPPAAADCSDASLQHPFKQHPSPFAPTGTPLRCPQSEDC